MSFLSQAIVHFLVGSTGASGKSFKKLKNALERFSAHEG